MRDDAVLGRALPLDRGLGPRNTSRMHIKLEKSVNWKFPFDLNLESNRRIVIYSVNVKFLLIAIYEFCYFVGVRRQPYCMQGCNSI